MTKPATAPRKLVLNRETVATLKEGAPSVIFAAGVTVSVLLCPPPADPGKAR